MSELKCWSCKKTFEHTATGKYPCGPCPTECISCGESCCPKCGGALNKESEEEEIRSYCGDGCEDCSWGHCGGCI